MAKGPLTVLTLPDGIAAHWQLPRSAGEALEGGFHNEVVRGDDLVVRLERRPAESVRWEHEVLAWLGPAIPQIHARGAEWPRARGRPGRPAYAELDWERNGWWDWTVVPKPPELVRAFEHVQAWIASGPPLVRTPIHAAYRTAGGPGELEALEEGRRIQLLADVLYALTRGRADSDWTRALLSELRELP